MILFHHCQILEKTKNKGAYDALMAYSGGKDSTYTLDIFKNTGMASMKIQKVESKSDLKRFTISGIESDFSSYFCVPLHSIYFEFFCLKP